MKIPYQKDLPVMLFVLLVSTSTLAALPHVDSIWTGVKDVYSEQDFGLHILRRAMLISLASQNRAQNPVGLDCRMMSGDGRLVWKAPPGLSLSACCGTQGRVSNLSRDNKGGLTVRPDPSAALRTKGLVEGWTVKTFRVRQGSPERSRRAHPERLNLKLSSLKWEVHGKDKRKVQA